MNYLRNKNAARGIILERRCITNLLPVIGYSAARPAAGPGTPCGLAGKRRPPMTGALEPTGGSFMPFTGLGQAFPAGRSR